ncbi:MAG: aminoacyl-tRNA hydrolase [Eubacterium sp.]|nr:aminoacyl-tRNA hydrolase [Eubacterium sp.]
MYMIVGLGNPGTEYAATHHNIGFDTITYLCDRYDIRLKNKEGYAVTGKGRIEGQAVLLVQPQTYMNESGRAVRSLRDYYKIEDEEILIVCDDINLPVGQIRVRPKGSAGGHNGLKSIIKHLGTEEFTRIRVGVGDKPERGDLVRHVLGRFSREEEAVLRDVFGLAERAVILTITDSVEAAQNQVNGVKLAND